MTAPRILIGGIFLESHSFAPQTSGEDSFVVSQGQALLEKLENSSSILGGAARRLRAEGADLIPTFAAVAPPGGLAEHQTYLEFRNDLVQAAERERPDGICLELHGAMGTTQIADSEGDLAGALREVVGPDVPIAVGLDMHACMTRRMLQATPIWVACKENPHTDYATAGDRAAELLLKTLSGQLRPTTWAIWLPLLLRGQLGTESGPLALLHGFRRALEGAPGVEDISIYNTYAFLDSDEAGQCVTVTGGAGLEHGAGIARQIAQAIWDRRGDFDPDMPSAEAVLERIKPGAGVTILGDYGDRVLGGSPGDGTYLLQLLGARPDLRVLTPLTDPEAVRRAQAAGVGEIIVGGVGGSVTPGETAVAGRWRVAKLGDGRFVQRGPFLAGEPAEMGDCAVLKGENLTVVATSKPALSQDPECFLSVGEDPADYDVVICKSGWHFKPAFATYGRTVAVDTPGLTNYVPGRFVYRRRPAYWPEDPKVRPNFRAMTFGASRSPHSRAAGANSDA